MTPIGATKLAQYLQNFTSLEIKRFKKILESPFHNTNQDCIKLFSLIRKYHPDYDKIPFTKEKLYEKLYGKNKYQSQQMNDLFKSLRILAEDFMIVSDILKNKENRQEKLIETFHNRNLSYFKDHSTDLIQQIRKHEVKDEEDYLKLYLENKRLYFHITNDQKIKGLGSFIEAHHSLDHFYLLAKYKFLTEEFNRKRMFKEQEGLVSWGQIENIVSKNILEENPIINALYQINQLQRNDLPEELFDSLTAKILNLHNVIEDSYLRVLLLNLVNYCISKNNLGNDTYNKKCLAIYQEMVSRNVLLENGILRDLEYLNISNYAFKYGSREWAEYFSSTYINYVGSKNRENMKNIVLAYKYFFLKEYKKIDFYLEKLNPIKQGFFVLSIKGLLIRSLFEDWLYRDIDNIITLSYQAKNYEKNLYRSKEYMGEKKIDAYLSFIQVFKKMLNLISEISTLNLTKINKLIEEIESREIVIQNKWLIKMLNELKKRF